MRKFLGWLIVGLPTVSLVPMASAHFRMLEPMGWLVENNMGDPQKLGPCGGTSADGGSPTNVVGSVLGGQKLHIKLQETVFHPGHYRVALAVNSRAELPADPEVTTSTGARGPQSVSAVIQQSPQIPLLADGLFVHTTKADAPWEADIQIPNISCPHCTLQIVEFMASHALNPDGGYFYHHCADLKITADPAKPVDKRWPVAQK